MIQRTSKYKTKCFKAPQMNLFYVHYSEENQMIEVFQSVRLKIGVGRRKCEGRARWKEGFWKRKFVLS